MRAVQASTIATTPSRLLPRAGQPRFTLYSGLVGRSPEALEKRSGPERHFELQAIIPEDQLHTISVVGGYVGLVAGFAAAAAAIW
jgi:hypothetical protein